jgi:hypothetical protein
MWLRPGRGPAMPSGNRVALLLSILVTICGPTANGAQPSPTDPSPAPGASAAWSLA